MKSNLLSPPSRLRANLLPKLLFLFSAILSIVTTYYVTGHILDSDASSELVLAKQLAETGKILSSDWYYSTELRVVNTQLVYAPMFLLFHDWHLVRFFSALVMQAVYILSYGFLLHQSGFSRNSFYGSASLLLLPVSVTYGRIVLYHCYYMPHIIISFLLVGLFLGFASKKQLFSVKGGLRLFCLLALAFLGGLGGIRQLMITHAPMLLAVLLACIAEDFHNGKTDTPSLLSRQKLILLAVALLSLAAAFLGYKVYTGVFPRYYNFSSGYTNTDLGILDFSELGEVLYGFLHQFGFRKEISMLSILGILSLGGIFAAGYCVYLAVRNSCAHRPGKDLRKTLVCSFFLCYTVVMTAVFLITSSYYYYPLYYALCLSWAVPLLLSIPEHVPQDLHPLHMKRLFSWAAVLILFVNGLANAAYFNGVEKFDQVYEGLTIQEKDKADQMAPVVAFLVENGYDAGYADFVEGNLVTELSDGQVAMTNLRIPGTFNDNTMELQYYNWLTSQWQQEAPKEKPFLLLRQRNLNRFENSGYFQYCTQVYTDEFHGVYRIDDLEGFLNLVAYTE